MQYTSRACKNKIPFMTYFFALRGQYVRDEQWSRKFNYIVDSYLSHSFYVCRRHRPNFMTNSKQHKCSPKDPRITTFFSSCVVISIYIPWEKERHCIMRTMYESTSVVAQLLRLPPKSAFGRYSDYYCRCEYRLYI